MEEAALHKLPQPLRSDADGRDGLSRSFHRRRGLIGCIVIVLILSMLVWAISNFGDTRPSGVVTHSQGVFEGRGILMTDLSNGERVFEHEARSHIAASDMAILFVVYFVQELEADEYTKVTVDKKLLEHVTPEYAYAQLGAGTYMLRDLYAAAIMTSGADAAYALANFGGSILQPKAKSIEQRVDAFMKALNSTLVSEGFEDTWIADPAGIGEESVTSAEDVSEVTKKLLTLEWFGENFGYYEKSIRKDGGKLEILRNANLFLDPNSPYSMPIMRGGKVTVTPGHYSIVSLYEPTKRQYLLVYLGAESDDERYEASMELLQALDASR